VFGDYAVGVGGVSRWLQRWKALDDLVQFVDLIRLRGLVRCVATAGEQQCEGEGDGEGGYLAAGHNEFLGKMVIARPRSAGSIR
jgi:hypothetical protein